MKVQFKKVGTSMGAGSYDVLVDGVLVGSLDREVESSHGPEGWCGGSYWVSTMCHDLYDHADFAPHPFNREYERFEEAKKQFREAFKADYVPAEWCRYSYESVVEYVKERVQ